MALVPRPFDDDIFAPPISRNSCRKPNGASRPKTFGIISIPMYREPPALKWSLPPPSTVISSAAHRVGHSTFHMSFALPPKGDILPFAPQPTAHFTRLG